MKQPKKKKTQTRHRGPVIWAETYGGLDYAMKTTDHLAYTWLVFNSCMFPSD